ncbi:hypothetical protein [Mycolicibacterium sp. XJ1819]
MAQSGHGEAGEYRVKDLWIKVTPGSATEEEGVIGWCGFCTTMDTCGGCTFCTAPSLTVLCPEKTLPQSAAALEELRVQLKSQLAALDRGEQEAQLAEGGPVATGVAAFRAKIYSALSDVEERRAGLMGD